MVSDTPQRIALAARSILDDSGADAITMRTVAKAAHVTAMAIYRHYPDRAALLNALADQGFADLTAILRGVRSRGSVETRILRMAEAYLEHALANPRLFELMFLRPRAGARQYPQDFTARRSPTATLMADIVAEGMQSGHFRRDDVWEITFEMGALSHGLILLFLGGRIDLSASAFRALYRRSFRRYCGGIRA
jgi:AcrR family transcriptional regulator